MWNLNMIRRFVIRKGSKLPKNPDTFQLYIEKKAATHTTFAYSCVCKTNTKLLPEEGIF